MRARQSCTFFPPDAVIWSGRQRSFSVLIVLIIAVEAVADARQLVLIVMANPQGRRDDQLCVAALDRDFLLAVLDLEFLTGRSARTRASSGCCPWRSLHADDVRLGGGNEHFKHRAAHAGKAHVHRIRNRA